MSKHTKGPWVANPTVATNRVNIFGTAKNQEYHIGTLQGSSEMDLDVFKANARLIAAAPELLEALKEINTRQWAERGQVDDYSFSILEEIGEICAAAITKATGEA